MCLAVAPKRQGVVLLPDVAATGSGVVEAMSLVDTTRLLANRGERTSLTVLVYRISNPVNASITANSLVLRVDENDLKVFVGRVLVNPIRVQDTQIRATTAYTVLSRGTNLALIFKLVHTLVSGLTVSCTLVSMALAATTANADTVDHVALLGLVTKTTCLVRAGRMRCPVDNIQLTVFPAADALQETEYVALLIAGKFLEVFVGTHISV